MTSSRLLLSLAAMVALTLAPAIARADLCDAGGCPTNEYCANADGGLETVDGGACKPEPCVVSNDCPSGHLCFTAEEPHVCVQCISSANCPGSTICDLATRTCVSPPEAGAPDASADGEADASPPEDASALDSSAPDSGPVTAHDSGVPYDASHGATPTETPDAGPDTGSLSGGACNAVGVTTSGAGGLLASAIFALGLAMVRRRRR